MISSSNNLPPMALQIPRSRSKANRKSTRTATIHSRETRQIAQDCSEFIQDALDELETPFINSSLSRRN